MATSMHLCFWEKRLAQKNNTLTEVAGLETQAGRGRKAGEGFTSVVACMLPRVVLRRATCMYSVGLSRRGGGGGGSRGGPCDYGVNLVIGEMRRE